MSPFPARALVALATVILPLLPAAAHAETHVVEVADGAFVPPVLTIEAGDTLRVINLDGLPHTFTADNGSYDSGPLMDGDATQLVLAATGAYGFTSSLGGQSVRVIVEAHRGAAHHSGR